MESVPTSSPLWPRVCLVALAALSLAPAIVHFRLVDDRLEFLRYPWGLIPFQLLVLRLLATLSGWLSLGILVAFAWSLLRPASTPRLLFANASAAILLFIAYASYTLFILSILLANSNA